MKKKRGLGFNGVTLTSQQNLLSSGSTGSQKRTSSALPPKRCVFMKSRMHRSEPRFHRSTHTASNTKTHLFGEGRGGFVQNCEGGLVEEQSAPLRGAR